MHKDLELIGATEKTSIGKANRFRLYFFVFSVFVIVLECNVFECVYCLCSVVYSIKSLVCFCK